jgi:hypothetical protein
MSVKLLVFIWVSLAMLIIALFIFSELAENDIIHGPTADIIGIVLSFASFITTSLFSITILNHNAVLREMNIETRRISDQTREADERHKILLFNSANLSVIDFVDHMLISKEREAYVKQLQQSKDFSTYLREDNVDINDVIENPKNYAFRTIKLPMTVSAGKPISKIHFTRIKFVREESVHYFVPATEYNDALIIYNESDKRQEAIVNMVLKRTSTFYAPETVLPCQKIKIDLDMQSLLGVIVKGRVELYFTNPKKLEGDGSNKYTINSSQFEINGLPELVDGSRRYEDI